MYSRPEVVAEFTTNSQDDDVWAQDFSVEELVPGVALLTYRSAHINQLGELGRHTLRASLWQWTQEGWKLRFHQGTPTKEFERHAV